MTTVITTKSASRVVINSPIIDTEITVSDGPKGNDGATGPAGAGVPAGGTTGQALTKLSATDYDTGWATISGGGGGVSDGDKGDITVSGSGTVWTIDGDAVTNAKLANVATATLKGRATAGTGDPEDMTGTQATTLLDAFTSALKGLVPASGGGTANFLRADGTFAAPSGGGSPGGSTTQLQFNNAGAFGGAGSALIEGSELRLPAIASPTAPATDGVKVFGRNMGGHAMPAFLSETGRAMALQASLSETRFAFWSAAGDGNTDTNVSFVAASTGTSTAVAWASTSFRTRMRWREWLVTVASTTAVAGFRGNALQFTVGGGAAGQGGFFLSLIWSPATGVVSTHRGFAGMRNSVAAPTDVDPSSILNCCGMGYDTADTNIQFMRNDGSGTATKTDLGASFPKPSADRTKVYQVLLYSPPGTTQSLAYLIRDLETGAEATGTVTTDLPSTTTALNPYACISVGGVSSVVGLGVSYCMVETDV